MGTVSTMAAGMIACFLQHLGGGTAYQCERASPTCDILQARQEVQAQEAERRAAAQIQTATAAAARQTQLQQLLKQKLELQEVILESCLQRYYCLKYYPQAA